jgi:hypothetical protein
MKTLATIFAALILLTSCIKHDVTPVKSSGNYGSWTYGANTFKGDYSSWSSVILVSTADKPHASALEAMFSSTSPNSGNYSIVPIGDVTGSNQVSINVVDSSLPAIEYSSVDSNPGTVSVSRSGGSVTVTVTNVKLMGITSDLKADSIVVTGTIVK